MGNKTVSNGDIVANICIIVITFIIASFFVLAEFALVQTRDSELDEKIKNHDGNIKKLKRGQEMVRNLNEYLSTTQVGTSLTGIILGWVGESTMETVFVRLLGITHLAHGATLHFLGAILGVILLTYLEVVLTEIVPKNISIDMPLKMLMVVVTPLHYFHIIFYPFVWLLNTSATAIVKMLGLQPAENSNQVLSQAEILHLSRNAVNGGALDKNDLLYMQRAFDLNDKDAHDIMVDRTSLEVVNITDTVKTVINKYLQDGYSRFPVVANNDKDKILGYVYIYDVVKQAQVDDTIRVSKLLRAIITVPEATPIQKLLSQMIRKQTPIAVVVDEYGGTSGIVTDKDIYEELFGTVKDEIDDVSDEYIIADENHKGLYHVSGKTTLYDFERFFHTKILGFDNSEIITVAGYILENYPTIKLGDVIYLDKFKFKVTAFSRGYVDWFDVTRAVKPTLVKQTSTAIKNTQTDK